MALKNYYLILGVSRGESQEGIRAAFRQLAKRYHPDRAGKESTPEFREILEAYQVLSDPERRLQYNRQLEAAKGGEPAAAPPARAAGSFWSRRAWTEFAARLAAGGSETQIAAFEAVLHPEQALLGTTLRVELPLLASCQSCGGSGREWRFPCLMCGGQGVRRSVRTLAVTIPPRTRHGTILEIPYRMAGTAPLLLRIRVRVAPY